MPRFRLGYLQGDVKNVLLLDVTPLSLGIETLGGVMTKLIERNTTIPARRSQVFSTAEDNQQAVTVRVFQGERELAADNKLLGQFDLVGIPPAPRGTPQIEVTFDIDANGIVNVSARDKATGKEQKIGIQASSGLTEQEIQRMVREAEQHAAEDRKRRELIEARNQADSLIYTVEKELKEAGNHLAAADRQRIDDAISALRSAVSSDDLDAIQQRISALTEAARRIAEARQQAGRTPPQSEGHAAAPGDDVVDAEFEDVDETRRRAS